MCVYSDSLDWVIDFTPYKLRYSKNHGPVKLYNMQSLSDRDCVYLSYLNTHKSYFGHARLASNLVQYKRPKIDFYRPRTPESLDPWWYMFDISQDQRAQYVYTVISLLFLSANLIYTIVLKQFIFESSFWKYLYFGIHLLTVAPSVCWYLWVGKPCWKWSQRFPGNKINFTCYHFQQNNVHEIYIFLFFKWTIQRLLKAFAWNWYSVKL